MSICVAEAETYSSLFTTVKIVNQNILPCRATRKKLSHIILNEDIFRNSKAFHKKNFRNNSVIKNQCFIVRQILTTVLCMNIRF